METENHKNKGKRPLWHRLLRWTLLALLCPILLFVVLTILLYLPPVQDWAVGIATRKISEETGKEVSIEKLRITPLFDISLSRLLIHSHPDTLVYADRCIIDLDCSSLLGGRIGVDAFDLRMAKVDTQDMLDEMIIRGSLGHFLLDAHDIDLNSRKVHLTHALADACDVDIAMRDTLVVKEDTTHAEIPWRLYFCDVALMDTRVAFHSKGDTMTVSGHFDALRLEEGHFDLERQLLHIEDLTLKASSLSYDQNYEPPLESGVDPNHLAFTDVETQLDILDFNLNTGTLKTSLDELKCKEKCGFELKHLSAGVELDANHILVRDAVIRTPESYVHAEADMDWASLSPNKGGKMEAFLYTNLSKQDVLMLAGDRIPSEIVARYPDQMLTAEVRLMGNMDAIKVSKLTLEMPGILNVSSSGDLSNLLDFNLLDADLHWNAQTFDLSLLQQMFGLSGFRIPALTFTGDTQIHQGDYKVQGDLTQGGGTLNLDAHYQAGTDRYEARLDARRLTVSNFVPLDSALTVTARAVIQGWGTDLLSTRSSMKAVADVSQLSFGHRHFSNLHLDGVMRQGHGLVNFTGNNEVFNADGCVELTVADRKIEDALFSIDMRGIDLYALGVTEQPFSISMAMHAQGHTDLKENHWLQGNINAITLQTSDSTYYPKDIRTELLMQSDTTFVFLSAGDLELHMNSPQGWQQVLDGVGQYWAELNRQIHEKDFDKSRLRPLLPETDICISSGRQNPLANFAAMMGYTYQAVDVDIHTDSVSGINGQGWVHSVNTGSILLDTIQFKIRQDEQGMELTSRVCNSRRNPDITFDARLKASLSPHHASLGLIYYDDKGRKGVDVGAQATFHNHTIRVHLDPLRPVLAYRYFTLNEDNYLFLDSLGHVDANLDLLADDGTGLKVFGSPNEVAEQDITVSVNHLNLGELCAVLPYMPRITGYLQGDMHLLKTDGVLSLGTDMHIQDMTYEGCPMGLIGVNAAYMPNEDGSHYVDGFLTQDGNEVLLFSGMYQGQGESDHLDADVDLQRFPLATVNGMLSDMVQLSGFFHGNLHIEGPTSQPLVNGRILTESMHLLSPNYSVDLQVQDDTLAVVNSRLDLSRVKAYSKMPGLPANEGKSPLQLGGAIDFVDLSQIRMDMSVRARNFDLINASRNRHAEAYGKVFVDLALQVRGLLNDLDVTGNLNVLGKSDLTYVLKDSPITVEDEMADLVTFVDFSDTLSVVSPEEVAKPANIRLRLGVSIDRSAQIHCLLSEDGSSYANIEGGGDLTLTYDEQRGMQLYGRYTINQGRMNYTMMVVTLKDCDIASGSYVDFNGDPFNPRLNISASERLNTTITENQTPRSVAFDVGMNVTQTLDNMGLEFTLEAPEDMTIQNEIAQMTAEMRGRVAVTLMATGMYIVEGKETGGFNTTNALNSFLNSQISQITGKALNTVDLSLGVQNTNTASGNITTDYSFRFAKRFWGNRISLIIGGKVSSGSEAENTGQSIIDNVSIEYRLDKSATRYVTLYYDNNYESILEGRVTEMGAGLVLRRKTTNLGELFIFRRKEKKNE